MSATCTCVPGKPTSEQWTEVDAIVARHRGRREALIPVLEQVQKVVGYLPEAVQRRVASGLGVPLSQVYGVVTFYSLFTMRPRGRHQVRVCLGTACHVRGGAANMEQLERTLGVRRGECTNDQSFSLEVVRCLGACGLAPVVVVDDTTYRQVKQSDLENLVRRHGDDAPEADR